MKRKSVKSVALVLSMIMAAFVFTGCGSGNSQSSTANEEILATSDTTLTIAVGAEVQSLYTLNMNNENYIVTSMVYETLVRYENGVIVPCLAESWEWNEDDTTITFKLKEGVSFHDGGVFNAEAVKQNLDFARSNSNFSGINGIYLISGVEVIDEYTVAVSYDVPCYAYLYAYCFPNVSGMASPAMIEEDNYQTMLGVAGTGPYVYTDFVSGDYALFTKNDKWWGGDAYYSEIYAKYIPEASSRIQALQTGEVDVVYGSKLMDYDEYVQAIALDGIEGQVNEEDTLTRNLVLNASSELCSDLNVRQAIFYSVDRETIAKSLSYDYESGASSLFIEGSPYTNVEYNTVYSYNLEKAAELLDEAGWIINESTGIREKDGTQLSLRYIYYADISINGQIATAVKSNLESAGIGCETIGTDMMTWWTEGVAGNFEICAWPTEDPQSTPWKYFNEMLGADPHQPSLSALPDYSDFESNVNAFKSTANEEDVAEIFAYLLNYVNDKAIDLPISYQKDIIVYNADKVDSYDFSSTPSFFEITNITPSL